MDYKIIDSIDADQAEVTDHLVIDGEYVVVLKIDSDREDPDEVLFFVDNLSGGENEIPVFADESLPIWSYDYETEEEI